MAQRLCSRSGPSLCSFKDLFALLRLDDRFLITYLLLCWRYLFMWFIQGRSLLQQNLFFYGSLYKVEKCSKILILNSNQIFHILLTSFCHIGNGLSFRKAFFVKLDDAIGRYQKFLRPSADHYLLCCNFCRLIFKYYSDVVRTGSTGSTEPVNF